MTGTVFVVDPALIGVEAGPAREEVCPRRAMLYAAAVGHLEERYFDDRSPEGPAIAPMFAVALSQRTAGPALAAAVIDAWPEAVAASARQVHYVERLQFHRPMRAGETLRIRARVSALVAHPQGTEFHARFDAIGDDGGPVYSETLGSLLRGVFRTDAEPVSRKPRPPSEERAPEWKAEDELTRAAPYLYDAGSGISYPIHTSRRFAEAAGAPDVILHGTAVLAIAARRLLAHEADGDPGRLRALACRFRGMALPGTTLVSGGWRRLGDDGGATHGFAVADHEGRPILGDGLAALAP